ncbi:hypothetical protein [Microcoleus sp. S28C3]|uniref:hypothetical protein n=1 Tax=Microcoleus sp. S28C3 TaxID=3055414 RepID=UPI002FD67F29
MGEGTGWGCCISYQIVHKHGGDLRCLSQPDRGTEFAIEILTRQSDRVEMKAS